MCLDFVSENNEIWSILHIKYIGVHGKFTFTAHFFIFMSVIEEKFGLNSTFFPLPIEVQCLPLEILNSCVLIIMRRFPKSQQNVCKLH